VSATNWYLEGVSESSGEVHRIALRPLPFRVGRHYDSDLRLESSHGSQRHAEFIEREGRLWLRDLGSTNGTSVNATRVTQEQPLAAGDIVHFADLEFRVRAERLPSSSQQTQVFSRTERQRLESLVRKPMAFQEMLKTNNLLTEFQPLVRFSDHHTYGYEVLGRGALDGKKTSPADLFFIAEKLKQEIALSVAFRAKGVESGRILPGEPVLFLNTHPAELANTLPLLKSIEDLRRKDLDSRLVLEIHEAAVTSVNELRTLRQDLDGLEIGLAFDDFGTGQARLLELIEVEPQFLKFDAVLIENLHLASKKRHDVVENLVRLVLDMGISPVAECIEHAEEAEVCAELGFELAQGYFFGRPSPPESWA
jgi:EAL domain-containing protein (putative c-di-GMP-specific phosphodiesterase class I)